MAENIRLEGSRIGYPREPGTPRDRVQREINRQLGFGTLDTEAGDIERFALFSGQSGQAVEGFVLVRRDHKHQPWVTWRWIIQFANGDKVPEPTGARLHSGNYFDDYDEAKADFNSRVDKEWERSK